MAITQNQKKKLLKELRVTPIVSVACKRTGFSTSSYYRLKQEDDEFSRLAEEAEQQGRETMNDLAESMLITHVKDGNMSAIRYWLSFNKKRYYTYSRRLDRQTDSSSDPGKLDFIKRKLGLIKVYKTEKVSDKHDYRSTMNKSIENPYDGP